MINMYGVKMVNLNDILQYTGRPQICNFVKENVDKILNIMDPSEVMEIDTSLGGNLTVYNIVRAYKLLFIPIDLVEEKMILTEVTKSLENVKKNFMTLERIDKVDKMITKYDDAYYRIKKKYGGDNIINTSCFMLIYEDNTLKDVYVAVPRLIINKVLMGKQQYQCSDCGIIKETHNHEYESFLPENLYYIKENNEIKYYCEKCKDKHPGVKHVGE